MNIDQNIKTIASEAIQWRQELHQNPGIAYDEKFASELIQRKLTEWGFAEDFEAGWGKNPYTDHPKFTGKGGHGVVLTIKGEAGEGETIGLRADIDALAVPEQTGLDHQSKVAGKMHACGHDGHTATLLTVAKHFSDAANRNFKGELKLIFQPAEEGAKGAYAMLEKENLLGRHPMHAIFAMHNWPDLPVGKIGVHEGPVMAASSYVDIKVKGKGAHAAKPEEGLSAARIIAGVKYRAEKFNKICAPEDRFVVTLEEMETKGNKTSIGNYASLGGTIRTFSADVLDDKKFEIKRILQEVIEEEEARINSKFEADVTIEFLDGSPATINTPKCAQDVREAATKVVGADNVIWNPDPETTAEDFGFFVGKVPLCYFWVGQGDKDKPNTQNVLHDPEYDYNDDATAIAAQTFVNLVHNRLG
ncbi:MAG: M20 family metallopeptidase [Bdellovibrionales bacterium]